jgi:hypothetical protein
MNKKYTFQIMIALVILAAILIFLGVNFVPQIYASSSARNNTIVSERVVRPDYLDEHYPRAILDSRISVATTSNRFYTGSDWIERHPSNYYSKSDWIDRHPLNYYSNSDWIERHPSQ